MTVNSLIRKILVPTDFSTDSIRAMNYGASIAEAFDAELILFHVNETPSMMYAEPIVAIDYTFIEAEIQKELDKLKEILTTQYKLKNVRTESIPGFAVDEIRSETEENNIDLIVMGTKSKSNSGSFLLGSVTASVIEKVECPVLTVPSNAPIQAPSRVIFATDYNEKEIQPMIFLINLLKPFKTEIFVLHVNETGKDSPDENVINNFQRRIQDNIINDRLSFHSVDSYSIENAFENFVKEKNIDWISTVMRRRSLFDRITTRSITRDLALHSDIPLLAFHPDPEG